MKKSIVPLLLFLATAAFAHATVKPVPGTEVGLERDPGNSIVHVKTGKDGSFTFSKLEPGRYSLRIRITPDMADPQSAGSPAKTTQVIVKIRANGRTIEAKSIPVTSTTKAGWVDIRTKSSKKLSIKIKKSGPKKIVFNAFTEVSSSQGAD